MKKKLATFSFRDRRRNRVIVFANQKGGAGKSTICTQYCHLLAKAGRSFVNIDADPQRTISNMRKKDKEENPDLAIPFNVYHFDHLDDRERTLDFINDALDRDDDVIIDSPGSLSKEGMRVLLMKADLIICPTGFDKGTVMSTIAFVNFLKQTAEEMGMKKHPPIIFVINRYQKNFGRKEELSVWRKTAENLKKIGYLAPKIASVADMHRYSTLYITPKQEETIRPFFDFVEETSKKLKLAS